MANTSESSKRLPIEKCGKFLEDPAFEAARSVFPIKEDRSNFLLDCVNYHDDRFEAIVDVLGLEADDLIITQTQQELSVEGKKENAKVGSMTGNVAFTMMYGLPQKVSGCTCKISSDGFLVITANWETPRKKLQNDDLMTDGLHHVVVLKCDKYLEDERFEPTRGSFRKPTASQSIAETIVDIVTSQCANTTMLAAVDCVYYHQDRFEAIIDGRGFQPSDIVCTMTSQRVDLNGKRSSLSQKDLTGNKNLTRKYYLPEPISAVEGACLLSSDGILVLNAPWIHPKKPQTTSILAPTLEGPVTEPNGPVTAPKSKIPLKTYLI